MADYLETRYGSVGIQTGTIVPYGEGTSVPSGYLECNGQSVSRTTYATLFAVIGTTYGNVDASNFNVPDLQDNVPVGKSTDKSIGSTGGANEQTPSGTVSVTVNNHTLTTAQMPQHRHSRNSNNTDDYGGGGLVNYIGGDQTRTPPSGVDTQMPYNGSSSAHNHGASGTFTGSNVSVLQPYLAVNYMIKT